jgi:uncharacterized protein YhdP
MANQTVMTNVRAEMNHTGVRYDKFLFTGKLNDSVPMNIVFEPRKGRQYLSATTNDAGAALMAFGLTDTLRGGRLTIEGSGNRAGSEFLNSGKILIKEFKVVNAPILGRILSLSSPGGLLDALAGEGIAFTRFESQFEYNDTILRLRDGKTNGTSLGLTFEGDINHAARPNTAVIKGTVVPLFAAVNNILSNIPLVGNILGKDGLLAFNYKASGPIKDPEVTVNPLSALTPGFLRDSLFDNSAVPEKKK